MTKLRNDFIVYSVLFFAFILKSYLFINELDLSMHKKFHGLYSLLLVVTVMAIALLFKKNFQKITLILLYSLYSFVFFSDVVYERYYDAILSFQQLQLSGQVGGVVSSIVTLIKPSDFLYFVDILILLVALKIVGEFRQFKRLQLVILLLIVSSILIVLSIVHLKDEYSDQYKISIAGILPAHIDNTYMEFRQYQLRGELLKANNQLIMNFVKETNRKYEVLQDSPRFGKYRGKNLIMIQAESLNTFPIGYKIDGKSITPFLDSLIEESSYFPNHYLQIGRGNTSDAEFVANNSIYPMSTNGVYNMYPTNSFNSIHSQLNLLNYSTFATHGNSEDFWNRSVAYPNQGLSTFYSSEDERFHDKEVLGMGISDEDVLEEMVDIYKEQESPFSNFIVTLSVHRPFILPIEKQTLSLPANLGWETIGDYLKSVAYFDKTLEEFVTSLKEEGIWDQSVFVLYGDHYGPIPANKEEIKETMDIEFDEQEMFRVPLIIHEPGQSEGYTSDTVVSQMDIAPTIIELFGLEKTPFFGESVFQKTEGFAGFAYETVRFSFYGDDYHYQASHDGVFENGVCVESGSEKPVNLDNCIENYQELREDIQLSSIILENDFIPRLRQLLKSSD